MAISPSIFLHYWLSKLAAFSSSLVNKRLFCGNGGDGLNKGITWYAVRLLPATHLISYIPSLTVSNVKFKFTRTNLVWQENRFGRKTVCPFRDCWQLCGIQLTSPKHAPNVGVSLVKALVDNGADERWAMKQQLLVGLTVVLLWNFLLPVLVLLQQPFVANLLHLKHRISRQRPSEMSYNQAGSGVCESLLWGQKCCAISWELGSILTFCSPDVQLIPAKISVFTWSLLMCHSSRA